MESVSFQSSPGDIPALVRQFQFVHEKTLEAAAKRAAEAVIREAEADA
jgi:hypothetical protein